jgi:NAD(P)-dependent dehydrogenase (short-subunit alcohol dehydrogenase family)
MALVGSKYILVTGAAKRIGAAIARTLADAGASVVVHYRSSEDKALALVDELRAKGTDAFAVQADLARPETMDDFFDAVLKRTGGQLDAIVNNASLYARTGSPEAGQCRAIHVLSPLALIRRFAALPHPNGGAVVNILDTRIATTDPEHAEYLAAKRELAGKTVALARELAPAIRVNAVAPGAVLQEDGMPVAALERLSAFNPLKAHGSPEGLASCVRFLLECDFITGQTIHYDGGYWMRDAQTAAKWHRLMESQG